MRLLFCAAEGGGGGGRGLFSRFPEAVCFQIQSSFLMSKKHGKCAFRALAPAAPAHMAAARPVMLSSAPWRGTTTHHEAHTALLFRHC